MLGFSGRANDVGFDQPEYLIKDNRKKILSSLGIDLEQLVCANQVHDDNVVIIEDKDKSKGSIKRGDAIASCDAMITKDKNIALAVLTADCLPIFIIDKAKGAIAIVHAGRKGTKKLIIKKTISIMQSKYQVNPKDLLVYFGPAIRRCCYEVGEEFIDYFKKNIEKRNNKLYLDLIEINQLQLQESGVLKNNILDCEICTSCQNDKFFSYRREGRDCGRQVSLILRR